MGYGIVGTNNPAGGNWDENLTIPHDGVSPFGAAQYFGPDELDMNQGPSTSGIGMTPGREI
jgi:hypothetical protein